MKTLLSITRHICRTYSSVAFSLASIVMSLPLFSSCQDEDNGFSEQEIRNSVYLRNFEKQYGKISEDQTWDFSSYNLSRLGLVGGPSITSANVTRAETRALTAGATVAELYKGNSSTESANYSSLSKSGKTDAVNVTTFPLSTTPDGWYSVESTTLDWLNKKLVEKKNNRNLGTAFAFSQPKNGLMIIPIYQGQAGMDWDLHVVDSQNDYNIWSRSDGLLYKDTEESADYWVKPSKTGANDNGFDHEHTIGRTAVVGRPMYFNKGTLSGDTYLTLNVTKGGSGYATAGTKQSSKNGMMLALSCPRPSKLNDFINAQVTAGRIVIEDGKKAEDCQAMIIGCEDANLSGSDWDMNDVVFVVVGFPYLPPIKEIISKRYMIEDLGSTFDFDFNDIVVDVTREATYLWTFDANGRAEKNATPYSSTTTASLVHLCGTIPFKIQIGNTVLGSVHNDGIFAGQNADCSQGGAGFDPTNVSPYKEYLQNVTVEGWNPDENNIVVTTWPNAAGWTNSNQSSGLLNYPDGKGENYGFPANGEYPYIIACDQTVQWTTELTTVTADWFATIKAPDVADPQAPEPEPEVWNYSLIPYTKDAAGNAVLWVGKYENSNNNVWYSQFNEFSEKSDADAKLFNALDDGLNTITFFLDNSVNAGATYTLRDGTWDNELRTKVSFSGNRISIELTEDEVKTIKETGGFYLVFDPRGVMTYITAVKASKGAIAEIMYTLSVNSNNDSMGVVTGSGQYVEKASATITATANEGYKFVQWNDGNTSASRQVTVTSDATYTATFEAISAYTISYSESISVSVEPNAENGKYYEGTKITLTVNVPTGYAVKEWTMNGEVIAGVKSASISVTVDADAIYGVAFEESTEIKGNTSLTSSGNLYKFSAMSSIPEGATILKLTFSFTDNVNGKISTIDQYHNIVENKSVQVGYSSSSPLTVTITNADLIAAARTGDLYMALYSALSSITGIEFIAE